MTSQADEIKANKQEIGRLLERDREYRSEIEGLHKRLASKDVVINWHKEKINSIRELVDGDLKS